MSMFGIIHCRGKSLSHSRIDKGILRLMLVTLGDVRPVVVLQFRNASVQVEIWCP